MKDIITLPESLKTQIQQAQNLLAQSDQYKREGDYERALNRADQGMQVLSEIAQRSPEMAVAILAAMHGYNGVEWRMVEKSISYHTVERRMFGMSLGTTVVPKEDTKETTKTIRFIK